MPDPTTPPERPLPDDARARIRAELLAHAHDHRSSTPRWAVPIAAAAAVALVAGLGYWAVNLTDDSRSGTPITGAGGDATFSLPPDTAVTSPDAASPPPGQSEPAAPPETVQPGTQACPEAMRYALKGAELALQVDEATSFWVKGDRFVLCDQLGGRTTIHRPLPLTPRDAVSTYAVSSIYEGTQTIRSAGGLVPAGAEDVFAVAYAFPDGHTERATTSTDDQGRTWWRMLYTYDDGGGGERDLPEIEVTVSLSGVQQTYTLEWGPPDTCAQANHGC